MDDYLGCEWGLCWVARCWILRIGSGRVSLSCMNCILRSEVFIPRDHLALSALCSAELFSPLFFPSVTLGVFQWTLFVLMFPHYCLWIRINNRISRIDLPGPSPQRPLRSPLRSTRYPLRQHRRVQHGPNNMDYHCVDFIECPGHEFGGYFPGGDFTAT